MKKLFALILLLGFAIVNCPAPIYYNYYTTNATPVVGSATNGIQISGGVGTNTTLYNLTAVSVAAPWPGNITGGGSNNAFTNFSLRINNPADSTGIKASRLGSGLYWSTLDDKPLFGFAITGMTSYTNLIIGNGAQAIGNGSGLSNVVASWVTTATNVPSILAANSGWNTLLSVSNGTGLILKGPSWHGSSSTLTGNVSGNLYGNAATATSAVNSTNNYGNSATATLATNLVAGVTVNQVNGGSITSLNASALSSGTVPTARLGSGTANNTTYLRGDNTWATPAGGGGGATNVFWYTNTSYAGNSWSNVHGGYSVEASGEVQFYPGTNENTYLNAGNGQVSSIAGGLWIDNWGATPQTYYIGDVGLGTAAGDFNLNDGTVNNLTVNGSTSFGTLGVDNFYPTNLFSGLTNATGLATDADGKLVAGSGGTVQTNISVAGVTNAGTMAYTNATDYKTYTDALYAAAGSTGSTNLFDSGTNVIVKAGLQLTNTGLSQLSIGAASATGGTNLIEASYGGSKKFEVVTNGNVYVAGSIRVPTAIYGSTTGYITNGGGTFAINRAPDGGFDLSLPYLYSSTGVFGKVGLGSGLAYLSSPASGDVTLATLEGTSVITNLHFGSGTPAGTNAKLKHTSGSAPELAVLNGTNGSANLVVSGTLTATNGVFGASGSLILSTNVSIAMAANTYTNVLFGVADYSKVFGGVTAGTDSLTNAVAGNYYISINASFTGSGASGAYEGAVFTNNVECSVIEWVQDVAATTESANFSGIITLPANCRIDYRIKHVDAETAVFKKVGLTVMGAN